MSEEKKTTENKHNMDFQSNFKFSCHPGVKCFTNCCGDVTIFLMPYDVARLKNRLGITSGEFMERHTHLLSKAGQLFPIVVLRMTDDKKICPFVTAEGCTVYTDRPWACRMFPLDMNDKEQFSVVADSSRCKGLCEESNTRVIEWLEDQGVMDYQRVNNYYAELTSHPAIKSMDVENDRIRQMIYMALYDLDNFRKFVLSTKFREMFEFSDDFLEQVRVDDTDLLKLGIDWIAFGLFGAKTLKVKPEFLELQKRAAKMAR